MAGGYMQRRLRLSQWPVAYLESESDAFGIQRAIGRERGHRTALLWLTPGNGNGNNRHSRGRAAATLAGTGSAVGLPKPVQRSTALEAFGVDIANLNAAITRVHAPGSLHAASTMSPCALDMALAGNTPTCACYRPVHMLPIRQHERLEGFPDATTGSERAPSSPRLPINLRATGL
ncbi:hypothetical protein CFE70_006761 [Pyrenophora teres f. teres 0-1]